MAIEKLSPFRLWTLQNFPFIAEDFDALTNYELMCKIVEYLNNVIDITNEQTKAINELKTWFDNLDVQDEIDAKLDAMVEDGTLAEIINQEIFGELNEKVSQNTSDIASLGDDISDLNSDITNVDNNLSFRMTNLESNVDAELISIRTQLSNMENINPIPVTNVNQMTDTSKIYVYTVDGNWYYYDSATEEWTVGGSYQSTSIGENEVAGNNLFNATMSPKYNYVQNKYISPVDGSVMTSNQREYCSEYIPINTGDSYYLTNARSAWCCVYDSSKNFLDGFETTSSAIHNISGTISTPNVAYIRLTWPKGYSHSFKINGKEVLNKFSVDYIQDLNTRRFKDYKVLFIGDSITQNNVRAEFNWVNYVTRDFNITNFTNGGMDGTGIIRAFGSYPNWITKLPDYANDYDLILIMGDMNDWSHGTDFNENNIGQYGDTTTDTFYGTMKVYLEMLLNKYPTKKIGWITSTPRNQRIGSTNDYLHFNTSVFAKANEVIKEMCHNYSIPVLDLYNESSLYPWLTNNNNEYFKPEDPEYTQGDGIHPNSKGQRIIANKIEDFIIRNF